jgi:ATP/maltotriose-dependent transcriptional regulator MalT
MNTALGEQDMAFGGGSCREAIVGYLNWAVELRNSTMTDQVRRDLDRALSDLENLAGWTSYDMLLHTSAQRFYLRSIHSAKQAGDPARVAWGLVKLGRVHWQAGHYGDALHMIQLATGPAREANSMRLTASIWQSEAMVFARQGNFRETETALSRTADDYSRAEPDPPAWLALTLDEAELHGIAATVYSDLAGHDPAYIHQAIDSANTAMRLRGNSPSRAFLVDRAKLALNAYRDGDTDHANRFTNELLAAASQVSSQRLRTTLLRPLAVEAAARDDSTAADLAQRLDTVVTAV